MASRTTVVVVVVAAVAAAALADRDRVVPAANRVDPGPKARVIPVAPRAEIRAEKAAAVAGAGAVDGAATAAVRAPRAVVVAVPPVKPCQGPRA